MARFTTELSPSAIFVSRPDYLAHPNRQGGRPYLYSFYVVNTNTGRVEKSFGFDIPPQQIRMEEDAAADVAAAQDGGYWTDERGQYFKMVTIAGTFGFRPTPINGLVNNDPLGVRASAEQVVKAVSALRGSQAATGIPNLEKKGNDRYRDLHNIIRFYWDQKQTRANAAKYVFIWADWKMGEVYIAQPLKFNRERVAPANRFQIGYNLTLRLLEPLNVATPIDFYKSPASEAGNVSWFRKIQQVADVLDACSQLVTDSVNGVLDYGFSVQRAILSPVNSVVNSFRDGVALAQNTIRSTLDIGFMPLNLLQDVAISALEAAVVVRTARSGFENLGYRYEQIFREIASAYVGLAASFGATTVNARAQEIGKHYKEWDTDAAVDSKLVPDGRKLLGDQGSKTSLGARTIPGGSKVVTVPAKTTIKGMAAEFLGDAGLWKTIVLLNQLVPPYFSPRGDGKTVLRPGDPIKLPAAPVIDGSENKVYSVREDILGSDAYRYGRDLRIDLDVNDLMVDEGGDLATVEGVENLKQAMHIKILTKPGDLKVHKWFGFSAEPGEGLDIDILSQYHLELERTILSDSRIEKINSISMRTNGDILLIRAMLTPKDQDDNFELSFRSHM